MENRIKEARKSAGITQEEMSKLFGIPKRTIGNWETGERKPAKYVEDLIVEKITCPYCSSNAYSLLLRR